MGLDSYLRAQKYVSGYEHSDDKEKNLYRNVLNVFNLKNSDVAESCPSAIINITVCYWRKANEIHNWFVQNCGDGVDECQEIFVSREKLVDLMEACQKALAGNPEEHLPTTSGFFFGSTEYDEYYRRDVEATFKRISAIIKNPKFNGFDFYYQASW